MEKKLIILEHNEKVCQKVKDFLIDVCINEFGFKSWQEELEFEDREKYKIDGGNFWVAIDKDEKVIGTIALKSLGKGQGILKSMYVDKNYRGQKIAQKLMDTLTTYALDNEYRKIELGTYTHLERAVNFYRKNNFNIKEQNDDVLILERVLCD